LSVREQPWRKVRALIGGTQTLDCHPHRGRHAELGRSRRGHGEHLARSCRKRTLARDDDELQLADPVLAAALEPGERIKFQFTIQSGMNATVTQIEQAE
jgi:hypothetical protein